jgi:O-antigen/teichoic acid export membrane protein
MTVAAIAGIVLNWLLVPVFGGMGAAIATVITYLVWIILSMIVSESLWRVGFPLLVLSSQVGVGMVFVAWFTVVGHDMDIILTLIGSSLIASILLVSSFNLSTTKKIIKKLRTE